MDDRESRAVELLRTTRLFYPDIAARTGLPTSRVARLRRKLGLRELTPEQEAENRDYNAKVDRGVALIREGYSVTVAAREVGLSRAALYGHAKRNGVAERREQEEKYIYGLACPLSKQVYYVGSSSNPWTRYYAHVCSPTSALMTEWLGELDARGLKPELKVLAHVHTNNWLRIEREWIDRLAGEGHPLMNQEAGWQ